MHLVYDFFFLLGLIALSPLWGAYLLVTGKWRTDWAARLGRCPEVTREPGQKVLLFHAVSVGEVNALRQLVETLEKPETGPDGVTRTAWRIVVAATTNTGYARATQLFAPRHAVVRYPLDFSFAVNRFLGSVRPDLVALVELEVWPNFMRLAERRGIPVVVINGRLSERSFKWYRFGRPFVTGAFQRLASVAVQTEDYAARFRAMGVKPDRVAVHDSMKWDTATVIDDGADPVVAVPGASELARALGLDRARLIIVAGSTGPGEEAMLILDFLANPALASAQLVLVPRKPERFDEVAALHPGIIRRTSHPDTQTRAADGSRIFLIDTIGELRKAYALCDVALIGRSFLGLYGSDPTESAGLGKPTVIGTHHKDFSDMVAAFRAADAIIVSNRPVEEAAALLADRERARRLGHSARRVILSRRGATARNAGLLRRLMAGSQT